MKSVIFGLYSQDNRIKCYTIRIILVLPRPTLNPLLLYNNWLTRKSVHIFKNMNNKTSEREWNNEITQFAFTTRMELRYPHPHVYVSNTPHELHVFNPPFHQIRNTNHPNSQKGYHGSNYGLTDHYRPSQVPDSSPIPWQSSDTKQHRDNHLEGPLSWPSYPLIPPRQIRDTLKERTGGNDLNHRTPHLLAHPARFFHTGSIFSRKH